VRFMALIKRIRSRILRELNLELNSWRVKKIRRSLNNHNEDSCQSVIFFNASTRLSGLSQNAGFSLIVSLALEAEGVRIVQLICQQGMSHCVLGTDNRHVQSPPPCAECLRTSHRLFEKQSIQPIVFRRDLDMEKHIAPMMLNDLLWLEVGGFPVGKLVLPSLRWVLRRHHLHDDEDTRYLAREYILSALNLNQQFERILDKTNPLAVVVFNGMFFPEATLRWAAQKRGVPVYSHEVGMLPLSAFFTDQEATAYPVQVDDSFQLSEKQDQLLDEFLYKRTQGKFVTAGIQFWPEIRGLDEQFWKKAAQFKSMIPVFTNVVFDTSQSHANVLFDHMFQWLDEVLKAIKKHPEILFVIRAHPDELRPGKESHETVAQWVHTNQVDKLLNVIFIPPDKYVSSYELIQHAKFVMVYNSTIGLEASILGKPVLCAGRARYTTIPTVFFPPSKKEYIQQLEQFLEAEAVYNPEKFRINARRVLYVQLFRASLPFDSFLEEDGVWPGYVRLKNFSMSTLLPENSSTIKVIREGILYSEPFLREV